MVVPRRALLQRLIDRSYKMHQIGPAFYSPLPYRTQQFTGRGDDKSAYNVLYRWCCIGWYYNKSIPFWDSTVMIFVRKLVLACLINSIKYIFISYSAHIWIKKCFRESFISDTGFYDETARIGQRSFITNSHSGLLYIFLKLINNSWANTPIKHKHFVTCMSLETPVRI